MPVNEIRDFIFEKYYKQIRFSKESSYYSFKCVKRHFLFFAYKQIDRKKT